MNDSEASSKISGSKKRRLYTYARAYVVKSIKQSSSSDRLAAKLAVLTVTELYF